MVDYVKIIEDFLDRTERDYIYNEFSLQFELGSYIREKLRPRKVSYTLKRMFMISGR